MGYMLNITAEDYTRPLELSEALGFGGQMLLIGMLAVFAVLGLIWGVLTVFKMVFNNAGDRKAPAPKQEVTVSAPTPQKACADTELIAVIAAAIAMAESECGENVKFRVVSFRRK